MIKNKINNVNCLLCELCAQQWEGECRAFSMPQSEKEKVQRLGDPQGLCQIRVLRWGYDLDHPERLKTD